MTNNERLDLRFVTYTASQDLFLASPLSPWGNAFSAPLNSFLAVLNVVPLLAVICSFGIKMIFLSSARGLRGVFQARGVYYLASQIKVLAEILLPANYADFFICFQLDSSLVNLSQPEIICGSLAASVCLMASFFLWLMVLLRLTFQLPQAMAVLRW